jgi:hypothetical protein
MLRKQLSLSLLTIAVILAAAIVTFTEIGKVSVAQGQSDITPSLTRQQKAAMCDPNNPKLNFVNGTESRICGIPKTITNTTSSENMTTGAEEAPPEPPPPSTSIAPSAVPPP